MWHKLTLTLLLSLLLVACGKKKVEDEKPVVPPPPGYAQRQKEPHQPPMPNRVLGEALYYPLDNCVACGRALGKKKLMMEVSKRLVLVCRAVCRDAVRKNEEKVLARIDRAYLETQRKTYPLDWCAVCRATLKGKQTPEFLISWPTRRWDGYSTKYACSVGSRRMVRLCSTQCEETFNKADEKQVNGYMHRINKELIFKQLDKYPSKLCPISKQEMGVAGSIPAVSDPTGKGYRDFLLHTTLIRVCCNSCLKQIQKYANWMFKGASDLATQPYRMPPKVSVAKGCCEVDKTKG